jgi:hypothetical protein
MKKAGDVDWFRAVDIVSALKPPDAMSPAEAISVANTPATIVQRT